MTTKDNARSLKKGPVIKKNGINEIKKMGKFKNRIFLKFKL